MNESTTLPLKDILGQTIKPGSIIIYGHALGRCAALRIGKVVKVGMKPATFRGSPEARITVHGIDMDSTWKPISLTKIKGTLMFPHRTVVIEESKVPPHLLDLMKDVTVMGCLCGCGTDEQCGQS